MAKELFQLYPVSHFFALTADRNQPKEETKGNSSAQGGDVIGVAGEREGQETKLSIPSLSPKMMDNK